MSIEQPKQFIPLNSEKGRKLFFETANSSKDYCKSFWKLAQNYETQITGSLCGIATLVMVLNSIKTTKNYRPPHGSVKDYHHFDQTNVFTKESDQATTEANVRQRGMAFKELEGLVAVQKGVSSQSYLGKNLSVSEFRKIASEALLQKDKESFIILYYDRPVVGQDGSYHISPLGGYHEQSDMFLLMDVARYKYETAWISTEELFKSVQSSSNIVSGYEGGFIIVSEDEKSVGKPVIHKPGNPMKKLMYFAIFILILSFILGFLSGRYIFPK